MTMGERTENCIWQKLQFGLVPDLEFNENKKIILNREIIILLLKFYWHIMSGLKFIEKYILLLKFYAVINSLSLRKVNI